MSNTELSQTHHIQVVQKASIKVFFSKPVTKKEAMKLVMDGDYLDILDEYDQEIVAVVMDD